MKPVKFVLLGTAVLTFLAIFAFAYLSAGEVKFTLWELRKMDVKHAYIIMFALALPLVFSGLSLKTQKLPRWQAIVSVLGFGISLFIAMAVFTKTHTKFGSDGGFGAKVIVFSLVAGLIASVVGSVKPDRG